MSLAKKSPPKKIEFLFNFFNNPCGFDFNIDNNI